MSKQTRRGRPTIYTRELVERVMKLVNAERTVGEALQSVAKQCHKTLRYVPFLVASARLGLNLRPRNKAE